MPGSYTPPHLRNKARNNSQQDATPSGQSNGEQDRYTLEEIRDLFWEGDVTVAAEHSDSEDAKTLNKTLHDSKATPGKLAFVILFDRANPRWKNDHIIFTKSNLELLPQGKPGNHAAADAEKIKDEVGGEGAPNAPPADTSGADQPIAIFQQLGFERGRSFVFEGWYRIALIDFLEPHSPELVRMLEQKWTRNRRGRSIQEMRSSEKWQASMSVKWAVVKFVKEGGERAAPAVERKEDSLGRKGERSKSVNEMLAGLRVKDVTNESGSGDVGVGKVGDAVVAEEDQQMGKAA